MYLNAKSIEKLRELINGEPTYRSGPELVKFFNDLGFSDSYGQGFPSRAQYTDEKLSVMNDSGDIKDCVIKLFNPIDYIEKKKLLDILIADFNEYLLFDGYQIVKDRISVSVQEIDENTVPVEEDRTQKFIKDNSSRITVDGLNLELNILEVLNSRFEEVEKCRIAGASLSIIFLVGSILEGLLLATAQKYPQIFNKSTSAPKDSIGKTKPFQDWTLANFIDVASQIGLLDIHIKSFSHVVRDFRNYIHPNEQLKTNLKPSIETADVCYAVLNAVVSQLQANMETIS